MPHIQVLDKHTAELIAAGEIAGFLASQAGVEQAGVIEAELHLRLQTEDGRELTAVTPASRVGEALRGKRVRFQLSPQRFHLFDPETEERIGR